MMRGVSAAAVIVLLGAAVPSTQAPHAGSAASLAAAERAEGWRLLFDGVSTKGWRGFKRPAFPARGWAAESGWMKHEASGGQPGPDSGDIITVDTFGDFDLRFEWQIAPGGNSGVKYFVTEERDGPIAHEYQLIDDARHPDAAIGPHRATAALYDAIAAPAQKRLKPAGEINDSRIFVNGTHVEHWLNGAKAIAYELGSRALLQAKAKSKFKDVPGWGEKMRGHILLQDHGDDVRYRNIRIRELPAKPPTRR
jgi:hypothetical protein